MEVRTSLQAKFKCCIEESIKHTRLYDFCKGSEYELGFMSHSGMVQRVEQIGIADWLDDNMSKPIGRICLLDISGEEQHGFNFTTDTSAHVDICQSTILNETLDCWGGYSDITALTDVCAYIPRVTALYDNGIVMGEVDIMYTKFPEYTKGYTLDYDSYVRLQQRIQLAIHAAACNRVSTLVVLDKNDMLDVEDAEAVAQTFISIAELYKHYLCNVIYITPNERVCEVYKSVLEGK